MKKFVIVVLSIIFVTLTVSSVQSTHADHSEPGKGLFKNQGEVNIVTTQDTKYKIYLQLLIRNSDSQLINVTESTSSGSFIPYKMSDYVFDTLMDKKETQEHHDQTYKSWSYLG